MNTAEQKRENRRKRSQAFAYNLLWIGAAIFALIIGALVFKPDLSAEAKTALVQWGTALMSGTIVAAAAYEWGSSKGSAMKDEIAAATQAEPTKVDMTVTSGKPEATEEKVQ